MEEVSVLVVEDVVEVVHGNLHGILDHGLVIMTAMHLIQTIQMDGLVVVKEYHFRIVPIYLKFLVILNMDLEI